MTTVTAKLPVHAIAYTGFNHQAAKDAAKLARTRGSHTNIVRRPVLGDKHLKHFTVWTYPR